MAWAVPEYSRSEINEAGRILIRANEQPLSLSFGEWEDALMVINNWRAAHYFPLNTFQIRLRRRAKKIDRNSLIAQRIKRLTSITEKLRRSPSMKLTQMQDIGGCRAIVKDVRSVYELVKEYVGSDLKHEKASFDDYIFNPKPSGYRGIHLVYRYRSDRKETYNGLKIEIQLRSIAQHAWATAVETVGTFIGQALKSSQGDKDWLRFFSLMSSAMAYREETQPVPNTPRDRIELRNLIKEYSMNLHVEDHLNAYSIALQRFEQTEEDFHFFLLHLDPRSGTIQVRGFKQAELELATSSYLKVEKDIRSGDGTDAVLVSVDSMELLRRAYPNYFADTHLFLQFLRKEINTDAY